MQVGQSSVCSGGRKCIKMQFPALKNKDFLKGRYNSIKEIALFVKQQPSPKNRHVANITPPYTCLLILASQRTYDLKHNLFITQEVWTE